MFIVLQLRRRRRGRHSILNSSPSHASFAKTTPIAERLLWAILRDRRFGGFKFRRHHPMMPYVVDYYCHEAKLAIELDGGQHNTKAARGYDEQRSEFLKEQGLRVLRFWNHDVLEDTDGVLEAIHVALTAR